MSRLTKFEITRIIGTRATQISNGAKPTTEIGILTNPLDIAKKELKDGTMPIIVVRKFPNGVVVEQKCDNSLVAEYFDF